VIIGTLRHPIEIHADTTTQTATGEITHTWASIGTDWASIRTLSVRELQASAQIYGEASHEIRVRYRSDITVDRTRRIVLGSRTFEVNGVDNIEQRNAELRLLCKEIV